jgi:hypothetical protein
MRRRPKQARETLCNKFEARKIYKVKEFHNVYTIHDGQKNSYMSNMLPVFLWKSAIAHTTCNSEAEMMH